MIKRIVPWLVLLLAVAGCNSNSPSPAPRFVHYEFLGYQIDYEIKHGVPNSAKGNNSTKDDSGKLFEEIDIRTGDVAMTISSGKVTVNREPRGTVTSGDRLKLMLSGKLFVNDVERGKE